jgi:hypothetical protein
MGIVKIIKNKRPMGVQEVESDKKRKWGDSSIYISLINFLIGYPFYRSNFTLNIT